MVWFSKNNSKSFEFFRFFFKLKPFLPYIFVSRQLNVSWQQMYLTLKCLLISSCFLSTLSKFHLIETAENSTSNSTEDNDYGDYFSDWLCRHHTFSSPTLHVYGSHIHVVNGGFEAVKNQVGTRYKNRVDKNYQIFVRRGRYVLRHRDKKSRKWEHLYKGKRRLVVDMNY